MDGTLAGRYCGTAGSGNVHGKTGSLSISIALSGCRGESKRQSAILFFVSLSRTTSRASTKRTQEWPIAAAVVLFCARGVPISPNLDPASSATATSNSITVKWTDEGFIRTGYRLYSGADAFTIGAPINLASERLILHWTAGWRQGTSEVLPCHGGQRGTAESPFLARVCGAATATNASHILVVDGWFDGWQFLTHGQSEGDEPQFFGDCRAKLSKVAYRLTRRTATAVTNGPVSLGSYKSVIWMLGTESTQDFTFDPIEQAAVTIYLNGGGNLFANGSEIGWDLDRTSTGPDDRGSELLP